MAALILILAFAVLRLEFRAMRYLLQTSLDEVQSAQVVPATSSLEDLLTRTVADLAILLDLQACRFELFPFDELLPRIEHGRIVLPTSEPGVAPCSFSGVELPVRANELTLGRFVLIPSAPSVGVIFSPTSREQAIARAAGLAGPLAAALARGDALRSRAYEAAVALSTHETRATSDHNRSRS
jgi:hypothetical protein